MTLSRLPPVHVGNMESSIVHQERQCDDSGAVHSNLPSLCGDTGLAGFTDESDFSSSPRPNQITERD